MDRSATYSTTIKKSQSTGDGHAGALRLFGAYRIAKLSSLGFFVGRGTVDARHRNIEKPQVYAELRPVVDHVA